ncbi:MAG TPA: hypothetical protein VHZ95_07985 [Polyangiales bacterium]|jgi:hypothetical protein|nr:hypothetical protein [Polyangiales bacterium]
MSLDELQPERARARRFGFCSLFVWAALGLALEAAHGFKWSSYLDDAMTRELLRLAHAHGVGLALLSLIYAGEGTPLFAHRADRGRPVRQLLAAASLLMPVGFALATIHHSEGDPGLAIWLVPLGGVCLLSALAWSAVASIRHTRDR